MKDYGRLLWLVVGLVLGVGGTTLVLHQGRVAQAGTTDRFEDFVLCTGSVAVTPRSPTDGVWLLDYRTGKLQGTVVDRTVGKVIGWAEIDLTTEFGIPPKQQPHFLMTTGQISQSQAALYVAETNSGKFGVYTMGPRPDNQPGVVINRHDLVLFRQAPPQP